MLKNNIMLVATLVAGSTVSFAQEKAEQKAVVKPAPIKQTSAASGKEMYEQYCASCHGVGGKGDGPAASAMKVPPTDLTQLSRQHNGKYPANSVATVLKSGTGASSAHGSATMPVWGPLLQSLDKYHDALVQQRTSNLVSYIETLQAK